MQDRLSTDAGHRGRWPRSSEISPLLANLFLHYAFDSWMGRSFPTIGFERYADDVVIHCKSLAQATMLRDVLKQRLAACKLEMSPSKTKIVYCKDGKRTEDYPEISFDFLGYTFRPRKAKARDGSVFLSFLPAMSGKAAKGIRQTVRDWNLQRRTPVTLEEIARRINPVLRGWVNYYGRFYRMALYPVMEQVDLHLAKWIVRKHKRARRSLARAFEWLRRIRRDCPTMFVHWGLAYES